ncbi:M24 family metallopeptidase [Nonomuraea cypriaca]|nr:M24 family metallopeptidase [Nonomuraea cypriaca]
MPQWGYRPQAPRTLRDGDVIYAEVFCNFGGRHTQHQVTMAIGEVHEDFQRAGDVVRAAYAAGLEALRPGRTFGELADAMYKPIEAADGSVFSIAVHSLNPGLALGGISTDIGRLPGAEVYLPVPDGRTFLADLELEPGMTFVFEPNYAFARHMVHIGGTVIVGEDEPIELSPYTAQILRATGRRGLRRSSPRPHGPERDDNGHPAAPAIRDDCS